MAPKKDSWQSSRGKRLLHRDIRSGAIHGAMDWEEAFEYRPEFAVGPTPEEAKRLFKNRLKTARKYVRDKTANAASELALLRQDRAIRPPPAVNHRGGTEPRWDGSTAQAYLKQDVGDKKHETMNRTAFYQSRPEYQLFHKRTISKHIDQEIRYIKFLNDYGKRRRNGH